MPSEKLPVVSVCENNHHNHSAPIKNMTPAMAKPPSRGVERGCLRRDVDGMDVATVSRVSYFGEVPSEVKLWLAQRDTSATAF